MWTDNSIKLPAPTLQQRPLTVFGSDFGAGGIAIFGLNVQLAGKKERDALTITTLMRS